MKVPIWLRLHPRATLDMLGYIPGFINWDDPRSAKEQLHANYQSGWSPFDGFRLGRDDALLYDGDRPMQALWRTALRDEEITVYECAWVMIRQRDGSFEIARMD